MVVVRTACTTVRWRGLERRRLHRLSGGHFHRGVEVDLARPTTWRHCAMAWSRDRQAIFAGMLGFKDSRILRGLYCADDVMFARPEDARLAPGCTFSSDKPATINSGDHIFQSI